MAGIAQTRDESRRRIHSAAARPIQVRRNSALLHPLPPALPDSLTARLHTRSSRRSGIASRGQGPVGGFGNVDMVSNTDSLVLSKEQLTAIGWVPARGDVIHWPDDGISVEIDLQLEDDGPVLSYYQVIRC